MVITCSVTLHIQSLAIIIHTLHFHTHLFTPLPQKRISTFKLEHSFRNHISISGIIKANQFLPHINDDLFTKLYASLLKAAEDLKDRRFHTQTYLTCKQGMHELHQKPPVCFAYHILCVHSLKYWEKTIVHFCEYVHSSSSRLNTGLGNSIQLKSASI